MTFKFNPVRALLPVVAFIALGSVLLLAVWTKLGVDAIAARHPPAGRFITVDGVRLHYTDHGTGPAVVFVHGASSNLLEFEASLVPWLSDSHRVLAFDRPGHGYSERGGEQWPDPARIADLILSASETLGAPQPLLVGHSWGGAVVMAALVHYPARITGGVLLAGAAGHWTAERSFTERLADWPRLEWLFARTLVYPAGSMMLRNALGDVFNPQTVPDDHADRVGAALALRPESYRHNIEDMNQLRAYLQRQSTRYREISNPLLAVHGTADELVPYWNHGRRLEPIVKRFEANLLEDVGHALHHVLPEKVASLIAEFYRRVR